MIGFSWVAELIRDSLRNLIRHKVRSILTLLGVVFGVASVITMLAIGEGAQRTVLQEIQGLGLRNIIIDSIKPSDATTQRQQSKKQGWRILQFGITHKDVAQMSAGQPGLRLTAAQKVNKKVYLRSRRLDVDAMGVNEGYAALFDLQPIEGIPLTAAHNLHRKKVAVITPPVVKELNAVGGPLGHHIRIGGRLFKIIGVVSQPPRHTTGLVFIPRQTAQSVFGTTSIKREAGRMEFTRTEIGQLLVQAETEDEVPAVADYLKRTLETNHEINDYELTVPLDILRSKQKTQRVFNLVLIAIATISLIVGGIGIMNIMLAIVIERIPEIGIRRAVGACESDIFLQFLVETLTLAILGGILGCLLGIAMVPLAAHLTGWQGIITAKAIIMALIVSGCVGVLFGIAPALRAARLNPVEALRF